MRDLPLEEIERKKQVFIETFCSGFTTQIIHPADIVADNRRGHRKALNVMQYSAISLSVVGSAIVAGAAIAAIPFTAGASLAVAIPAGAGAVIGFSSMISKVGKKALKADDRKNATKTAEGIKELSAPEAQFILWETAYEAARIFEYQISRIKTDADIQTMAGGAIAKMLNYLEKVVAEEEEFSFEKDVLLTGIVEGKCKKLKLATIFTDDPKWDVDGVFSKPGLRFCGFGINDNTKATKYGYRDAISSDEVDKYPIPDQSRNVHTSYKRTTIEVIPDTVIRYAIEHRKADSPVSRESLNEYITRAFGEGDQLKAVCRGQFPDGIDLSGGDFQDTDFSGAKLVNANLRNTNFSGAYLTRIDLTAANLTNAHFDRAYLPRANLTRSFLEGAIFYRANFSYACITDASLSPLTDMSEIIADAMAHENVDLEQVRNGRLIRAMLIEQEVMKRQQEAILERLEIFESQRVPFQPATSNIGRPISYYQPRATFFTELQERFRKTNQVAIVGIAGSGKTQLAIDYARKYRKRHPDSIVWKFNARNPEILIQEYISFAKRLGMPNTVTEFTAIKGFF
jgi:hypothetical protein